MWYNSAGTLVLDDIHQSNNPNTSWQRFSQTRVCPATAATFEFRIYQDSIEGGGTTSTINYLDAVLVEESSTLNTYFDGSTSATEAAWTGTAHASTSTYVPKIYVDAALLEQSSTAGVYFDGSRQYATEAIHSYIPGDIVYVGCVDSVGTSSSDWSISGATVSATKGTNIAISSASYSSFYGTTAYNTSSPHYFNDGDTVAVTGITPNSFNRTATVNVNSSTQFFFSLFNGSTGGAYSSGGIAKTLIPSFEVSTAATTSTSGITGTAKPLIKVTAVDDGADINGSAIPGYVRYTAVNTFSAGDKVSFVGTVGTFNVNDATIVAATATHFVIASALTGSTTTGYAYASSSPLVLAAVEQTRPMGINYTSQVVLDFSKFTFDSGTAGIIDTSRLG